jgi:hypothetical protein
LVGIDGDCVNSGVLCGSENSHSNFTTVCNE